LMLSFGQLKMMEMRMERYFTFNKEFIP